LHRDRNDERRKRRIAIAEIGQQGKLGRDVRVGEESREAADFGLRHRVVRRGERADHRDAELYDVGEHDTPKPGAGSVERRDAGADEDGGVLVEPDEHAGDLDGREG
jgi:hypothetical protein